MPTLDSYGGPDFPWPRVERKGMVTVRYDGEDRLIGFVGDELERGLKVYTSRRNRHHYYNRGEGYAISDSALNHCKRLGVTHVLLHEEYKKHVYEFALDQYLQFGHDVPDDFIEDDDDPQTYVKRSKHQFRYPDHADEMFVREFDAAIEFIKQRRA